VPWHRVINSKGTVSTNSGLDIPTGLQQRLLEKEGIVFDAGGVVEIEKYLWRPKNEGGIQSRKSSKAKGSVTGRKNISG